MIGMPTLVLLLVLSLGCARLTRLVVEDEITLKIKALVVKRLGKDSSIVYLLHCRWCAGMWVSALLCVFSAVAGLTGWATAALLIPAVAYGSNIIRAMIEE